jgi:hypothetical protein
VKRKDLAGAKSTRFRLTEFGLARYERDSSWTFVARNCGLKIFLSCFSASHFYSLSLFQYFVVLCILRGFANQMGADAVFCLSKYINNKINHSQWNESL